MANESIEISDIVKKSKILLLDIEGTTTSISFVKDKLFPYAEDNVKEFLDSQWDQEDVKEAVSALRKLALEDQENSVEGVVTIPAEDASKEDQIEGLVKNVKWQMSSDRKVGALKTLQGLIWKKGYDKGDIKGHIYDDVLPAIEQWRSVEGQKVYIYSSGSVQAQKLLFGQSSAGDLLPLIDGHFDTSVGAKQEAASYVAIAEKISCKPEEILFLTDILKEGEAARTTGLHVALVSREGNAPLPAEATASFPVLQSFAQLTVSNKRKTDDVAQDEQPAKVPKTDNENDVKTTTEEVEASEPVAEAIIEKKTEETEKMDVDEGPNIDAEQVKEDIVPESSPAVEEVTASKEVTDTPVSEVEQTITKNVMENSDKKETEEIEAESVNKVETVEEPKEQVDVKNVDEITPVSEETPSTVITEIEDITDDKQTLSEVAEIIEDLEPIVEEPAADADMEELQNVGEVLDKECDEILSKVQDVTNLDSIPLKPLLNPIAEETMDTENIDSNDIVDRILDTEIELGMKPCDDIDLNTVEKIADEKITVEEVKIEQQTSINVEEKPEPIIVQKSTEEKIDDSNSLEAKSDECKEETKESETNAVAETEVKTDKNKLEVGESKVEIAESKVEVENKMDTEEINLVTEESQVAKEVSTVVKEVVEESTAVKVSEVADDSKAVTDDSKAVTDDSKAVAEDSKAVADDSKAVDESKAEETTKIKENNTVIEPPQTESKELPKEKNADETEVPQMKEICCSEESKLEGEAKDAQINGNKANGNGETANLNGDANKDEELSSRLSVENGKEDVNGSNGDTAEEQGQGDNKVETEVSDIKLKTVAADEPRSDPIAQPSEA